MSRRRLIVPIIAGLLVASIGSTTGAAGAVADNSAAGPRGHHIASAEPSGTLRFAMTSIPSSMDPSFAGLDANLIFLTTAYDGLVRLGEDGSLAPGLATEWSLSDDGLTFEMSLRDDVTFQDGEPFNADAVVANIEHFQADDSLISPQLSFVDSVEAVDETTVRFNLSRPGGDLPELLRGYAGLMASPVAIAGGNLGQEPVGAGPFRVTSMSDTMITFERWDGYWNADEVSLAGVEIAVMTDDIARMNALRSDQLDGTFVRPDQVAEAEAAGLLGQVGPATTVYGLTLNPATEQFADADVRRAVSIAIDRAGINDFLYGGACEPTVQLFAPDLWAYDTELDEAPYLDYNPEEAAALISAAAPDGLDVNLLVSPITAYQRLAEVLQQQFAEVGITMTIETVDTADRDARRRAGDFEMVLSPLYPQNPDPSTFAEQYYRLGVDSTEYIDPAVPELIAQMRLSADRSERAATVAELTRTVLAAGTTMVGICIPSLTYMFNERVSGYDALSATGVDFRTISMEA